MGKKESLARYVRSVQEGGAEWAREVPASAVVTAAWVRFKCEFGCSGYGEGRLCPPLTPTPEETEAVVACYRRAIVAVWEAPPGRKERRAVRKRMHREMLALERAAFLDGHYKALAFVAGPCRLCATCTPDEGCKRPGEARPAMEACGMDVYATLANAGYTLKVVTDPDQPSKLCGLLLVD